MLLHVSVVLRPQFVNHYNLYGLLYIVYPIHVSGVKCKVVPVLDQVPHHEEMSGSGGIAPPFLNSALNDGVRPASCTGRITPGERAHCAHWIGGFMVPRTSLEVEE
jgi:hypothetical protein